MCIRDFHPIDLNKDEVVQLLCKHSSIKMSNNFANRSRLSCPWGPRDVNAGSCAISDGNSEARIDGIEFGLSTWEGDGYARYVK